MPPQYKCELVSWCEVGLAPTEPSRAGLVALANPHHLDEVRFTSGSGSSEQVRRHDCDLQASFEKFSFTFSKVSGTTNHSINPQFPQTRKWTTPSAKKPTGKSGLMKRVRGKHAPSAPPGRLTGFPPDPERPLQPSRWDGTVSRHRNPHLKMRAIFRGSSGTNEARPRSVSDHHLSLLSSGCLSDLRLYCG